MRRVVLCVIHGAYSVEAAISDSAGMHAFVRAPFIYLFGEIADLTTKLTPPCVYSICLGGAVVSLGLKVVSCRPLHSLFTSKCAVVDGNERSSSVHPSKPIYLHHSFFVVLQPSMSCVVVVVVLESSKCCLRIKLPCVHPIQYIVLQRASQCVVVVVLEICEE
jgi:hypothetical protein